ncbi:MAG: metallophosphoesterase [Pirellulaceae bacterium]
MMELLKIIAVVVALVGHVAVCVFLFNRLNALPIPRWTISLVEKLIGAAVVAGMVAVAGWLAMGKPELFSLAAWPNIAAAAYVAFCVAVALWTAKQKWPRPLSSELRQRFTNQRSRTIDVQGRLGKRLAHGWKTNLLAAVPGNQIFELDVTEKTFELPTLPESLDGLSIAHVSDLHYTGQIDRLFYDTVIDELLSLDADLVMIAGDIIDRAACIEWIRPTLGRLAAPHGVFAILGNHDKRRSDPARVRAALNECGIIDLGGTSHTVQIDGVRLLLAGNERPWYKSLPKLPPRIGETDDAEFRLLLSHTPDQIGWARQHGFDLMLAGHTHGGQIRFPWLGPVIAPSLYGAKYASGVFYEAPTLMHVSRGVAGLEPIRLNCRPEISRLVLRCSVPVRGATSRAENVRIASLTV